MTPEASERKASTRVLAGKCRCGAVRYEVSDAFLYAANCHCSECRAATGSAFKAFAGIEREKLTITEGVDDIAVFGEEDLNDTRCGSFLFSVVRDGAFVHVAMGSLVEAPTIRPTQHIFAAPPGEPMAMYHWEADQEDFLVLSGEALLIVEGEERRLRQWDFVHCPAETKHVIVGAGDILCTVLAVGARENQTTRGPDGTLQWNSDWGGRLNQPPCRGSDDFADSRQS